MAEKRGVDRCVLKLIDAHEFAFSEVDFADPNEQAFDLPTHKTSSVVKSEVSGNSHLPTSLARREEKFLTLQTKIRNCSNNDVWHWYKKRKDVTHERSAELVVMECEYRKKLAEEKGKK